MGYYCATSEKQRQDAIAALRGMNSNFGNGTSASDEEMSPSLFFLMAAIFCIGVSFISGLLFGPIVGTVLLVTGAVSLWISFFANKKETYSS